MDWKKIQQECPRAFKLLTEEYGLEFAITSTGEEPHKWRGNGKEFNIYDLYDFFDELQIYPVQPFNRPGKKKLFCAVAFDKRKGWESTLYFRAEGHLFATYFTERIKAVEASMEVAFILLERDVILKNNVASLERHITH